MSQVTHRLQSYLRSKVAYEFPTEEALKKYLDEHPGADKSLHYVAQPKPQESKPPETNVSSPKIYHREGMLVPTVLGKNNILKFLDLREDSYTRKWLSTLSGEQEQSLEYYGDKLWLHREMNSLIKGEDRGEDATPEKELRTHIDNIQSALEKAQLPESIYIYRGMNFDAIPREVLQDIVDGKVKPDDVQWTDKGFVSASIDGNDTTSSGRFRFDPVICRVVVPKGTHGAYVGSFANDNDFLLAAGYTFQLNAAIHKDGKYIIKAEIVPKPDTAKSSQPDQKNTKPDTAKSSKPDQKNTKTKPLVPTVKTVVGAKRLFSKQQESYSKWEKSISKEEEKSLRLYTGSGYKKYNTILRQGKLALRVELGNFGFMQSLTGPIKKISDVLGRYKLPKSVYVYRGMNFRALSKEMLQDIVDGKISPEDVEWSDKAFVSTSINPEKSFLDKQVRCRIALPKGTQGAYVANFSGEDEEEFLIDSGYTFKLRKVTSLDNGSYEVDAELVLDSKKDHVNDMIQRYKKSF